MAWVQVGTTDIHYAEHGRGIPLVFLHGFGSCAEAWFQQADTFSDRFRVIAYDSVNHGHSSNSPRDQAEPDRADELEGFLAALGLDAPVLAGNSMGALTILRWAVRHPETARALIPSGMGVVRPGTQPMSEPRRREMFDPVSEDVLFLPGEGGFNPSFSSTGADLYQRYVRLRSTATRIEASRHPRRAAMDSPTREELVSRVGSIRSPLQIVVGENDRLADAARHLHELVDGSRLAVVPGGPHNVYYETAADYNRVVSEFLDAAVLVR